MTERSDAPSRQPSPRVLKVTQEQYDRIERAWALCAWPSERRIADRKFLDWWYWAVHEVTGIDVRDEPAFTLEVVNG